MTNAERQRRYRERRTTREPVRTYQRPMDRRPRPKQWTDAVAVLQRLQAEYAEWRESLPEGLGDGKTAELLDGVADVDLDQLDIDLPRGFGRD